MTPAEVDIVLAHLADAAAALPQAARQLGDILKQARDDYVLEMDTLSEIEDPDLGIDSARLHLDGVGEAALGLYRLLDTAHNETRISPPSIASRSTPMSMRRRSHRSSHGQRTGSRRRWGLHRERRRLRPHLGARR